MKKKEKLVVVLVVKILNQRKLDMKIQQIKIIKIVMNKLTSEIKNKIKIIIRTAENYKIVRAEVEAEAGARIRKMYKKKNSFN